MTQGSKLKLKAKEQLVKCPSSEFRPREPVPQASLLETHQGALHIYFPLGEPWVEVEVEVEASGGKGAR